MAAALPTALSGLAEWHGTGARSRRVGLVHATLNAPAFRLYAASHVARRRRRQARAVALGLVGGAAATLGGHLGGHLSIGRHGSPARPVRAARRARAGRTAMTWRT